MKKILLFICAATAILMVGCSSKDSDRGRTEDSTPVQETAAGATPETPVANELPSVVDFSATWCGPCKKFAPMFHAAAEQYEGKLNFVTVDIDEHPELAQRYNVEAVPTIVFLDKNGREINRITGLPLESDFQNEIAKLL